MSMFKGEEIKAFQGVAFFAFVNVISNTGIVMYRGEAAEKEGTAPCSRHLYVSMELWQYLLYLAVPL